MKGAGKKKQRTKQMQFTQSGELVDFIEKKAKELQVSEASLLRSACHKGLECMFDVKIIGNKVMGVS
jgi:hypothetical protein